MIPTLSLSLFLSSLSTSKKEKIKRVPLRAPEPLVIYYTCFDGIQCTPAEYKRGSDWRVSV